MRKLNILIGGSLLESIGIESNGGGGIFTYSLASELAKRGHNVTILGLKGGYVPNCTIIPIADPSEVIKVIENYPLYIAYQLLESKYIALNEKKYDIVHISNYHYLFAPFSRYITKPVIYTEHLPLLTSKEWQEVINKLSKPEDIFIFIAKHEFQKANLIKNKECILHGVNTEIFSYSENTENYMFWIGRTKAKKGLKEAVSAAKETGKDLFAAQATRRIEDQLYFDEQVKPVSSSAQNIKFLGTVSHQEKIFLYQKAKLFLFPISWEEPFGLTMIEALSTGTPVVAFARGSVPEIIKDGETGFIINPSNTDIRGNWIIKKTGIEGLCEGIKRIYAMSDSKYKMMRKACRSHVETHFTIEKMVDKYENIYQKIIAPLCTQ